MWNFSNDSFVLRNPFLFEIHAQKCHQAQQEVILKKKKEKFAWIHLGEELEPHAPPQNEPKARKFEICQNSTDFDLLFHTQFVIP